MENIWIVVADSSRARLFVTASHTAQLTEFETLSHAEGKQHERSMTSDLPGSQAAADGRHHSVSAETDAKKFEAMQFAKTIAQHLDEASKQDAFTQLVVVAAPAFLGLLREAFSDAVAKRVTLELDKNLSQHNVADIRQHLPEHLPSKAV